MPRKKVSPPIYIGVYGTVLALDRTTGEELWRAPLKKGHFISVVLVDDVLLATAAGEIFSLSRKDGSILWHNKLKGFGHGLVTVAGGSAPGALSEQQQTLASAAAAMIVTT